MLGVLLALGWLSVSFFFLKKSFWYESFSVFSVLAVVSVGMVHSYGWASSELGFSVDSLSGSLVALSVWISGLMLLASIRVWSNKVSSGIFVFLVGLLCLVLVFCFIVSDSFSFYLLFEASLIPTLFLILGWGYQPERLQAGFYMIFYTVSASLPLLLIIVFKVLVDGHCCFFFEWDKWGLSGLYSFVFWFCLVIAFLVKLPVFFVHLWLPKAHVEAPVAGSMILAAVLLKLGGFGLMRFSFLFPSLLSAFSKGFSSFILWGSVVTSLICLRQSDVKSLIAYSSVGHMGLLTVGVLSGTAWGWQGALLMMVAHGLCSSALFNMANVSYEAVGTRSGYLSKGAMSFFPALTFWWFLFCVGNMAAPPFLSLPAEIFLISSVLGMSNITFLFVGALSFFGGAYSLYLFTSLQHGKSLSSYSSLFSQYLSSYACCFYHLFPLGLLALKLDLFSVF